MQSASSGAPHAVKRDKTGDSAADATLSLADARAANEVKDGRQIDHVAEEV